MNDTPLPGEPRPGIHRLLAWLAAHPPRRLWSHAQAHEAGAIHRLEAHWPGGLDRHRPAPDLHVAAFPVRLHQPYRPFSSGLLAHLLSIPEGQLERGDALEHEIATWEAAHAPAARPGASDGCGTEAQATWEAWLDALVADFHRATHTDVFDAITPGALPWSDRRVVRALAAWAADVWRREGADALRTELWRAPQLRQPWRMLCAWAEEHRGLVLPCDWHAPPIGSLGPLERWDPRRILPRPGSRPPPLHFLTELIVAPASPGPSTIRWRALREARRARMSEPHGPGSGAPERDPLRQLALRFLNDPVARIEVFASALAHPSFGEAPARGARYAHAAVRLLDLTGAPVDALPSRALCDAFLALPPDAHPTTRAAWARFAAWGRRTGAWRVPTLRPADALCPAGLSVDDLLQDLPLSALGRLHACVGLDAMLALPRRFPYPQPPWDLARAVHAVLNWHEAPCDGGPLVTVSRGGAVQPTRALLRQLLDLDPHDG